MNTMFTWAGNLLRREKIGGETLTVKSHHSISPRMIQIAWIGQFALHTTKLACSRGYCALSDGSADGMLIVHTTIMVDCGYSWHRHTILIHIQIHVIRSKISPHHPKNIDSPYLCPNIWFIANYFRICIEMDV